MKIFLTRLCFLTCAVIGGFAIGRMSTHPNTYYEVPAHEYADFHVSSETMSMTPMRDTSDLQAMQGLTGPHQDHVYTLDSITFHSFYFRTGWTAYIKTGGYVPDTCLYLQYQGHAVCVSPAVQALIIAKYLGR